MTDTDLQVRLQVAKQACYIGGDELRRFYRTAKEANIGRDQLLIEADAIVRKSMSVFLGQVYSKDPISGKGVGQLPNVKNFWVIDALGGEKNYAAGGSDYSTTLVWVQDGVATLGVIFNPITKVMYNAIKGVGAFVDTEKIGVKRVENLDEARTSVFLGTKGEGLDIAKKLAPKVSQLTALENPALSMALAATGQIDCFAGQNLEPWHWLAGKIFIEEAGGTTSDFAGSDLAFTSRNVLATSGLIHNEALKALA